MIFAASPAIMQRRFKRSFGGEAIGLTAPEGEGNLSL